MRCHYQVMSWCGTMAAVGSLPESVSFSLHSCGQVESAGHSSSNSRFFRLLGVESPGVALLQDRC